jgi:alpha-L-rhamnosidase
MDQNRYTFEGCSFIWLLQETIEVNQYVEFYEEFKLEEFSMEGQAQLRISCDSDYAVWINGSFVGSGQYDDFPYYKVYDELEVFEYLRPGKNRICIQCYYQGEDSGTYYAGTPCLIYQLCYCNKIKACSTEHTRCRKSMAYQNGSMPKNQIGFVYQYDASRQDDWLLPDYQEKGGWDAAVVNLERSTDLTLYQRPIQKLKHLDCLPCTIIAQGSFLRRDQEDTDIAHAMSRDYLSHRAFDELFDGDANLISEESSSIRLMTDSIDQSEGVYLILDLGREDAGYFHLKLSAREGTRIDIGYGEHLEDMRVRTLIETRHFASRYICSSGNQSFTHYFSRLGGRYLQVHIHTKAGSPVTIQYMGLIPVEYPVEEKGSFSCSQLLHERICLTAVRTLHLCMHEHYEDTPWREQALYAMDSRNQALCGYYCFGEYAFAKASFRLLAKSLREDGYLDICAPGRAPITIPSFTMAWIMEVKDYYLYSGDQEFVLENLEIIKNICNKRITELKDGLLITPKEIKYWNFYDWADDLSGEPIIRSYELMERRDAPLNLYFIMALEAAAYLFDYCDDSITSGYYKRIAADMRAAFHKSFWNKERGLYHTYLPFVGNEVYSELVQSLAICAEAVPKQLQEGLLQQISGEQSDVTEATLSMSLFKYMALMKEPERYAQKVFDDIAVKWGFMLSHNATSFWETLKGASDFDNAGSLCHGWSAIPVYFYYAYILGVRPLEPGFLKFILDPLAPGFYHAEGKVPTPYGEIQVEWNKCGESIEIKSSYPPEIEGQQR